MVSLSAVTETADRYRTVAAGFADRLGRMRPDDWTAPTPCPDWDVAALVDHVLGTHRSVLAAGGVEPPAPGAPPAADFDALAAAVLGALADPDVAGGTVTGMFGSQPFESLVGRLLCADTLIHTWDLARATGQDERLDPDAVAAAHGFLQPIDEAIRRPGGFAAKIDPGPDADDQTRFLNFCGRSG